jgi:A/G-specific adenine glycosylase
MLLNPDLFQTHILTWFEQHGRKNLPWQHPTTPYHVWVSEIMLQQTQVTTVIPYFKRFIQSFPCVESLAAAPLDNVLHHWAGLGYYARARNLHKAAQQIVQQDYFPDTIEGLTALSGIGRSTAGAILSIAFQKSAPILDGNVRRVLTRFCGIEGWTGEPKVNQKLWEISTLYTPLNRVADYTQAMMDLGATLCTRNKPLCLACPIAEQCVAKCDHKTALLPTPKPRQIIPVKTCIFLILQNAQQLLIEKRPAHGIWGGLWSFPEFESPETARAWCIKNNLVIDTEHFLSTQRHTFSHYHLDYTALQIVCENKPSGAENYIWQTIDTLPTLAFPAPIMRLWQDLYLTNEE